MRKVYYAKLYDNATWYERFILYFRPYITHAAEDGFVVYKTIFNRLYVYVHGHYVQQKSQSPIDPGFDGGQSTPWSN